jgi:hypothetical protein
MQVLFENGNQDHSVLNTDSKQGDETDACGDAENRACDMQGQDAEYAIH